MYLYVLYTSHAREDHHYRHYVLLLHSSILESQIVYDLSSSLQEKNEKGCKAHTGKYAAVYFTTISGKVEYLIERECVRVCVCVCTVDKCSMNTTFTDSYNDFQREMTIASLTKTCPIGTALFFLLEYVCRERLPTLRDFIIFRAIHSSFYIQNATFYICSPVCRKRLFHPMPSSLSILITSYSEWR